MKKETGAFTATDDDGNNYTVYIYTNFIYAGCFENPYAVVEDIRELGTSDGMAVNRLQKGEYQIVQTGTILKSSSPDAP